MEIKPCKFCGYTKPKITTKRSGGNCRTGDLKQVMCGRCKARGPIFGSKYEDIPDWFRNRGVQRTPEEAEELAILAWNCE
jgi:hypothetical protein